LTNRGGACAAVNAGRASTSARSASTASPARSRTSTGALPAPARAV